MADRKIRNISNLQHPLSIRVLNETGANDIAILLAAKEVCWCPNDRDTKPLIVYAKKKFLELTNESKPAGARYYECYPEDYWGAAEVAEEAVEVENQDGEVHVEREPEVDHYGAEVDIEFVAEEIEAEEAAPATEEAAPVKEEIVTAKEEIKEQPEEPIDESNLQKGPWEESEVRWLAANYGTQGVTYCAKHLNRNISSVKKKASYMGLKRIVKSN